MYLVCYVARELLNREQPREARHLKLFTFEYILDDVTLVKKPLGGITATIDIFEMETAESAKIE